MSFRNAVGVLLALALAACATPPPPPPPLLTIDWREDCAAGIDLSTATGLVSEKKRFTVEYDVPGVTGPCRILEDGRKASYALFALPYFAPQSVMIAGGALEEIRIFAPDVFLLDEAGAVTRHFSREDFLYQGIVYGVQFKPRETEKYVLIQAAPELVGELYDSVTLGINSQTVCSGYFCMNSYSGVDYQSTRQFSYSGKVSVLVQDLREDD